MSWGPRALACCATWLNRMQGKPPLLQHACIVCRLPASALQEVDLASPVGVDVVVNGSFSTTSLTASNSGVSTLRISGASAQSASLQNTGCVSCCL